MYTFTVLFTDDTTAKIKANDLDEAYFKATNKFSKSIADIWCD